MPTKNITNRLLTSNISRVFVKDAGWVEVVPGSFQYTSLNFYYPVEGEETEEHFTGLSIMSYKFTQADTNKIFCIPTDALAVIEMAEVG